jgi:hypothetical protein
VLILGRQDAKSDGDEAEAQRLIAELLARNLRWDDLIRYCGG